MAMSRRDTMSEEGRANIRAAASKARTCPHCGHTGKGPQMFRYHFTRCPKFQAKVDVESGPGGQSNA